MRVLRRYPWFFGTLSLWTLLAWASGWALLYSPASPSSSVLGKAKFLSNGHGCEDEFQRIDLPEDRRLTDLSRDREREGWKRTNGDSNLARWVLEAPSGIGEALGRCLTLDLFSRNGDLLLVWLLRPPSGGQVYAWTTKAPREAFLPWDRDRGGLPLELPPGARSVHCVRTDHGVFLHWEIPAGNGFPDPAADWVRAEGFEGAVQERPRPPGNRFLFRNIRRRSVLLTETKDSICAFYFLKFD